MPKQIPTIRQSEVQFLRFYTDQMEETKLVLRKLLESYPRFHEVFERIHPDFLNEHEAAKNKSAAFVLLIKSIYADVGILDGIINLTRHLANMAENHELKVEKMVVEEVKLVNDMTAIGKEGLDGNNQAGPG